MEETNPLDEWLEKYKIPLILGIVGAVLLLGGMFSSGLFKGLVKSSKSPTSSFDQTKNQFLIKVDVSGAVVRPGVYTLANGSRVEEALKAAGGVSASADPVFLSKTINLAQKITDGMKVYIPAKNMVGGENQVAGANISSQNSLVNINEASLSELDKLPSVGPVIAQQIIDKRPYGSIEELLTKKAVTKSVFDKIKGMVSTY